MKALQRTRAMIKGTWQTFRAELGGQPSPTDDSWYSGRGFRTASGITVSPDQAMRLAAVFACVRVISETIASLPLVVYQRTVDAKGRERKVRTDDHPLYDVLQKPNQWQTGFEFWEMMQAHLELRGNGYAEIAAGNGRAIDQLLPIHPDRVSVFRLSSGRLRYEVRDMFGGPTIKLAQEEMFHYRGLSADGIVGMSTISAGAEVIGVGLAQQDHRARSFANSAIPGLYLRPAQKLDQDARENLQQTIRDGFSGKNAFKAFVGIPGMEVTTLGLTNKDAQLIEASAATRTDIASLFRLPPHKIGDLTRGTFSNIEQQNIEFATDAVRPRLVRLERRIDADLVDAIQYGGFDQRSGAITVGQYYVAADMDALLRGDIKSRYEAYNVALQFWLTPNEVRAMEGKNPVDNADEIMRPANMMLASAAAPDNAGKSDANAGNSDALETADDSVVDTPSDEEQVKAARLRSLAMSAANRVVRREIKGLRQMASKANETANTAGANAGFDDKVTGFYNELTDVIADTLVMPRAAAVEYARSHALTVTTARLECLDRVIDQIEEESGPLLVELAMGGLHEIRTHRR